MAKRPLTFNYVIFYLLFLPDTWQVIMGVIAAYLLVPLIIEPTMGGTVRAMLYVMFATIGYAVSRIPAKWISDKLKSLILGRKRF
ncbi:MAG: hypothetical protein WBG37_21930 [Desulfobacterales bacterium]